MTIKDLAPWNWSKKDVEVRREDEDPVYALQRRMDRLFDDLTRDFELTPFGNLLGDTWAGYSPSVDIKENEKEFTISAELPGMDEKDVEVTLTRNLLTLKGEKKHESEEKEGNYHRMERSYGRFERSIQLPDEIEEGKAEAAFKKGVLTVRIPKSEAARKHQRRIPVQNE